MEFETEIGGKELKIQIGEFAPYANGSVVVNYGGTTVLVTATLGRYPKDVDYLPLVVDYEEKLYAAGKIKSSRFIKREGRPSDEAILTARLIDRAIRPLFDKRIRNEIQVIVTVLSFDKENDPDVLGLIGASCALCISDIPWNGPIGGVRIARENSLNWIVNPSYSQRENSNLDLIVAGKKGKINMLEGGGKELKEDILLKGIEFSLPEIEKIIQFQKEIIKKINPSKKELEIVKPDEGLINVVKEFLKHKLEEAVNDSSDDALSDLSEELKEYLLNKGYTEKEIKEANLVFEEELDKLIHKNILEKEKRPDGRKLNELREISCKIGFLPKTHGSGLFKRGKTHSLSVVTLGAPGDEQIIDGMEIETKKKFFHHYNFPPYCVGEVAPIKGPGRREIGHSALAERAIVPVLPKEEDFPYTIRVVSEILSSRGSSSMASVSSASLALMDAGVPIKRNVTGIAMGLMIDELGKRYKILTDIQGPEDHHGDMDLKIAGTSVGITSLQMDVKVEGVDLEILKQAFYQAKEAREKILDIMNKVIKKPREELSPNAPRILTLQINPEKIRDVIGPQGKTINEIIEETGVKIDIKENGLIYITSDNEIAARKALQWIKNITREIKVGEVFQGKVKRIVDFGAFVEILPGHEGLIHISELSPYRVRRVEDVIKVGDIVPVMVKNIDDQGRIQLTLKGHQRKRHLRRSKRRY